jgi:hypothetical protein
MGVFVATVVPQLSVPQFSVSVVSNLPSGNIIPVKRDFTLKANVRYTNNTVPAGLTYLWSLSPESPRSDYQMVGPVNQQEYYVAPNTLVADGTYIFRVNVTVNAVTLISQVKVTVSPNLGGCVLNIINEDPTQQIGDDPSSGIAMGSTFTMSVQECTGGVPPFVYSFGYNVTTRLVSSATRISSSSIAGVRFPLTATKAFAFIQDQASNAVQLSQPLTLLNALVITDVTASCSQQLSTLTATVSSNAADSMLICRSAIQYCDTSVFVVGQGATQAQINQLRDIFTQVYNIYSGLVGDLALSNPGSVIATLSTSRTVDFKTVSITVIQTQINAVSNVLNSVNLDPSDLTPTVMEDMIGLIASCFSALIPSTGNLNSLNARQDSGDVQSLALAVMQQVLTAYVQSDQCIVSGSAKTVSTSSLVANVRRVVYDGITPGDISRAISETSFSIPTTIPAGCYDVQAIEWTSFRNATYILSKVISVNVYTSGTATSPSLPAGTINYSVNQNVSPAAGKEAKCVFWDTTTSLWSPTGCSVTSTTGNVVSCSCPFVATRDYSLKALDIGASSSSPASASSTASATEIPTSTPTPIPSEGANVGAIVGGVIGGLVVLGLLIVFSLRKKPS